MSLRSFLLLLVSLLAIAQEPIRVTVTSVPVDAIVTDRHGRAIADLKAGNFELFENGKRRDLDGFSFIPATEVRRTLVFIVDDRRMRTENLQETKNAIEHFAERQMRPDDIVAVVTTSGNLGRLQRFTSDRNLVKAAASKLRIDSDSGIRLNASDVVQLQRVSDLINRRILLGTLSTLRSIFDGMRSLPGRKAAILFAEGLQIQLMSNSGAAPMFEAAREVTEAASRSSVVIYPVDPRGPQPVVDGNVNTVMRLRREPIRRNAEQDTLQRQSPDRDALAISLQQARDGLTYLAEETGGLPTYDSNDPSNSVTKVLNDLSGYYLLSFRRGADSKAGEALRKLTVKLKDAAPGLRVRYRRSYLGSGDAVPVDVPAPVSPGEKLRTALQSPFAANDGIALRFAPLFTMDPATQQPLVRGLVHIDGSRLTLGEPDAGGARVAALQFAARIEDPEGRLETNEKAFTVMLKDASAVAKARKDGLVYVFEQPVPTAGAYHLRVAVLDVLSGVTGGAGQFPEIPATFPGKTNIVGSLGMTAGDIRQAPPEGRDLSTAIRAFSTGEPFSFGLTIFRATEGLSMQAGIRKMGESVWTGKQNPVTIPAGGTAAPAGGVLNFRGTIPPGQYIFEVRVFRGKQQIGHQQLDFELIAGQ